MPQLDDTDAPGVPPARPPLAVITDSLQGELEVTTEAGTGKAKDSGKVRLFCCRPPWGCGALAARQAPLLPPDLAATLMLLRVP